MRTLTSRVTAAVPVAVAAVLLLVVAPLSGSPPGFRSFDAGAWIISAAAVGLLAALVRWPLVVLAGEALLSVGYAAAGYHQGGPYWCVLIVLYRIARHRRTGSALAAGTAALASIWLGALLGRGPAVTDPTTWGSAVTLAVLLAGRELRQRQQLEAAAAERIQLADAARAQHAAQQLSEERVRIARDLHDVIGHNIAMITVQAGVAAHVIDDRPQEARQALLAIRQTSKDALHEIRRALGALRDDDRAAHPVPPPPGMDHLDQLIQHAADAGLSTTLQITGPAQQLPAAVDLAAYRLVQESLTNAIKYAAPATASLHLTYTPSALHIEMTDTGTGNGHLHAVSDAGGHGLHGMRERVTALGGWLDAGPALPAGYRVRAYLPLRPES